MNILSKVVLLIAFCLSIYQGQAQQRSMQDHQYYLNMLGTAKDSLYHEILNTFDEQIKKYPNDVHVQLEKCRLIEKAYYDYYEEYNPNYEEATSCVKEITNRFPENPEALLYQAEFLYGDSLLIHLENLRDRSEQDEATWKVYAWNIYKQLAEQYQQNEDYQKAVKYGELATAHNDTLDMTLLIADGYKNLKIESKAIDALLSRLDSTNLPWELNQKGRTLLELGVPDKAIEAFHISSAKNASAEDEGALAQAMIDNGLINEARPYLLKASENNTWSSMSLQKLVEYDLKYSKADSAHASYQRLASKDFWNDPVGIYRMRLSFKDPSTSWTFADVGRILLLIMLIILPFIVPYLWILPIHYYGQWQKQRGKKIAYSPAFAWGLKQFWMICSLWLLCDIASFLIFDYSGFVGIFNSDLVGEVENPISKNIANATLFFFTASLIFTAAFLKKNDIVNFVHKIKSSRSDIGLGIGLAVVLKVGLGLYVVILQKAGISLEEGSSVIVSINENILSINQHYSPFLSLLFVVILVPFYEEVLFRGIFLSACERNMRFIWANILQAIVFALVHQSLKFFPFYFAFGIVAGTFRQRSQSLIIPTSMHMVNNLLAFLALTWRG